MRLFAPAVATSDAPAPTVPAPIPASDGQLRRRGLIAGAAALAAATLAAQPVAAAPLVGTNGAVASDGNADGVQGYAAAAGNAGVAGRNNDLNGMGVVGTAPSGIGVSGSSGSGPGVSGVSASGHGAVGISTSGYGVFGQSGGAGVFGVSTGANGAAFQGYPGDATGYAAYLGGRVTVVGAHVVSAPAGSGYSLFGYGNTGGYGGVWGLANVNSAVGVVGQVAGG